MRCGRTFWFLVFSPPLLAAAVLAAASFFPIRLDHRSLQHLSLVEGRLPDLAGRDVWFLSRGNSAEAGRFAAYTLRHLVFPEGSRRWMILSEHLTGPWWGEWVAVDVAGNTFAPARPRPHLIPFADRNGPNGTSVIVCESRDVWMEFIARIPSLANAGEIVFLDHPVIRTAIVFAPPRNEFSLARWWHVTVLLGALLSIVSWCTRMFPGAREGFWLGASLGVFLAVAVQLWVLSFGWAWWPFALGVQWLGTVFGAAIRAEVFSTKEPLRGASMVAIALTIGVLVTVFLLRLDFDGDVLTHWLPMARSHYHAGLHDPNLLLAEGSMHAATYPPGYGSFLAVAMWCADMDRIRSFSINAETSLAIFFYRIAVATLNVALLVALASFYRIRREGWLWLAAVAWAVGLFSTLQGNHVAAETLLFPMLSAGLIAVVAGGRLETVAAVATGLWILGAALIVKWEAVLLVLGIGVPWVICSWKALRPIRAARMGGLGILVIMAVVPAMRWKLGLEIDNGFFASPSIAGLWEARRELGNLFIYGMMIVLKTTLWIPLLILLPVGLILRATRGTRASDWLVPGATAALFCGLVSIYVFSNWPAKPLHMDQSFERLLLVPAFSALLYFLETLSDFGRTTNGGSRA